MKPNSFAAVRIAVSAVAAALIVVAVILICVRAVPSSSSEDGQASPYRIVGVWEGKVAVFLPDSAVPEQVYDTRAAVLPQEEQRRLENGIIVYDSRALKRVLEDYLS